MLNRKKIVAKKMGEVLIERGLITHEHLDEALKLQKEEGGLLGEILVRQNHVTDESIAWAVAIQYGLAYLPLSSYEMSKEMVLKIPRELAKKYGLIAIDKIGSVLTVAMSNPLDGTAIGEIEKVTGCVVRPFISSVSDVMGAIDKFYKTA